jgi:hypothetical protein
MEFSAWWQARSRLGQKGYTVAPRVLRRGCQLAHILTLVRRAKRAAVLDRWGSSRTSAYIVSDLDLPGPAQCDVSAILSLGNKPQAHAPVRESGLQATILANSQGQVLLQPFLSLQRPELPLTTKLLPILAARRRPRSAGRATFFECVVGMRDRIYNPQPCERPNEHNLSCAALRLGACAAFGKMPYCSLVCGKVIKAAPG